MLVSQHLGPGPGHTLRDLLYFGCLRGLSRRFRFWFGGFRLDAVRGPLGPALSEGRPHLPRGPEPSHPQGHQGCCGARPRILALGLISTPWWTLLREGWCEPWAGWESSGALPLWPGSLPLLWPQAVLLALAPLGARRGFGGSRVAAGQGRHQLLVAAAPAASPLPGSTGAPREYSLEERRGLSSTGSASTWEHP